MSPEISVIIAAYNAEMYIGEAIESVIRQTEVNFEILIVNDGSIDGTEKAVCSFNDNRIRYFYQKNQGVSAARNLALTHMQGDYFCFLDADDIMPERALAARLERFKKDRNIDFVDGFVSYVDEKLQPLGQRYEPDFTGDPLPLLLRLDRRCLFGNTWMIRKRPKVIYRFCEALTHAEDLYFYLSVCNQYKTRYDYTNETILLYRQRSDSAMKNLKGLEKGYLMLLKKIRTSIAHTRSQFRFLKLRIMRIMFLSHLFDGRAPIAAIRSVINVFRA